MGSLREQPQGPLLSPHNSRQKAAHAANQPLGTTRPRRQSCFETRPGINHELEAFLSAPSQSRAIRNSNCKPTCRRKPRKTSSRACHPKVRAGRPTSSWATSPISSATSRSRTASACLKPSGTIFAMASVCSFKHRGFALVLSHHPCARHRCQHGRLHRGRCHSDPASALSQCEPSRDGLGTAHARRRASECDLARNLPQLEAGQHRLRTDSCDVQRLIDPLWRRCPRTDRNGISFSQLLLHPWSERLDWPHIFVPPPQDGNADSNRAAILSFELWQRHFGSDPGILGSKITLDDKPYTIVGVMPPGFQLFVKQGSFSQKEARSVGDDELRSG